MLNLSGNSPRTVDTVVGRELWRPLAQPPAQRQTTDSSRLGQMWLCYPDFENLQRQRLSSLSSTCFSAALHFSWNYVFPAVLPKLQTSHSFPSLTALYSWEGFVSIIYHVYQGVVNSCWISPFTLFFQTKWAHKGRRSLTMSLEMCFGTGDLKKFPFGMQQEILV